MNCLESQAWLQHYLDGDAPEQIPSPTLSHFESCAKCRSQFEIARCIREDLPSRAVLMVPRGLTESILAQVMQEQNQKPSQARRILGLFALAASLLLIVFLPQSRIHRAKTQAPDIASLDTNASMRASVAKVGDVFAQWTTKTAEETVKHTRNLLPKIDSTDVPLLALATPQLPESSESIRSAGAGVSKGIEPVTRSARQAFSFFLKKIPSTTEGNSDL